MPTGKPYPEAFKLSIVEEALQPGVTGKSVAERHGLAQSMVSRWVREFAAREHGEQTIPGNDVELPADLLEAIEPEINGDSEPEGLIIPDSKNRIMLILALLESGYKVWMTDQQVYYDHK